MAGPQTCRNLRPGRCCQGRPIPHYLQDPYFGYYEDYRIAQWTGLSPFDIAAVWRPVANRGACSGVPMATTVGPGNWRYPATGSSDIVITGASYIKIPSGKPKEADAPWLEAQGILGLVTGGGRWVSGKANTGVMDQINSWAGTMRKVKRKAVVIRGEPGMVFAQPPAEVNLVWTDLIVINGTGFTQESEGSSMYRSETGEVLDFKDERTEDFTP
ncbi:MAG: hypothetical protein Q9216_006535 [Gyalolechia sp. 2 TL-2023]